MSKDDGGPAFCECCDSQEEHEAFEKASLEDFLVSAAPRYPNDPVWPAVEKARNAMLAARKERTDVS